MLKSFIRIITLKIRKIIGKKYASRIFDAVFWSMSGAIFQKGLILISSFVCIWILGKEDYGRLGIIRSAIQIFVLFGAVGLGSTATKYLAEHRDQNTKLFNSYYTTISVLGLLSGTIVTVFIILFAKNIAIYLEDLSLVNSIRVGAIFLFFSIVNAIQTGVLTGVEDFKSIAISCVFGGLFEFLAITIGSVYWGVNGALVGYGLGLMSITIINEVFIANHKTIALKIGLVKPKIVKEVIFFSIPLLGSSLMVSPVLWYVQSLLLKTCNYTELAIYTAAEQWRIVLSFIPISLSRIILPMLSNAISKGQKDDYLSLLLANIKINLMVTSITLLCFIVVSPLIIYLYGFSLSVFPVFLFLTLSTVFSCLATIIGQAILSKSKPWIGFFFNLGWGTMIIMFSVVFLKAGMKSTGIALAILISYFIHTFLQSIYLKTIISNNDLPCRK